MRSRKVRLKKFYLGSVRNFGKQMWISDGGTSKIECQSDVYLDDSLYL
jgi:hypothetical protein